MATRTDKTDSFRKPTEDKFDFDRYARDLDAQDQFAQVDTPPGIGLRQFLERETRLQAASTGSSETLIPGRLYLRQQPGSGLWELTRNRGRGCFDSWVSESREEMLALAESLQEGGN